MNIPEKMNAAVLTEYGKIEWREVPVPQFGESEVLVKVSFANICGSDMHIFKGDFHPRTSPPLIMGHEFFGTVVAVGSKVTNAKIGDRVAVDPIFWCEGCAACSLGHHSACTFLKLIGIDVDGGFGEYVPAKDFMLYHVPDEISDQDAAMIEVLSIGFHACKRSEIKNGDQAAIWSAGRVGHCVLQAALTKTDKPIFVVDILESRLEIAGRLSPKVIPINALKVDPVAFIKEQTGGRGVDIAFEAVGHAHPIEGRPNPLRSCLQVLRGGGTVCALGLPDEPTPILMKELIWKEAKIVSSRVTLGEFSETIDHMARGNLRPDLLASAVLPMSRAGEAFRLLEDEPEKYLKITLAFD